MSVLAVVLIILLLLVLFGGVRGFHNTGSLGGANLLWLLLFVILVVVLVKAVT